METLEILDNLKRKFELKDNHILILEALQEKDLIADEISEKTDIPKGRIYEFLNELLEVELIEKIYGTPAKYTAKDLEERIYRFFGYKTEDLMKKQLDILAKLEKKKEIETVEIITGSKEHLFCVNKIFSEAKHFRMISWQNAVSQFFYPKEAEECAKVRSAIVKSREVLIKMNVKHYALTTSIMHRGLEKGKKADFIITKNAFDSYCDIVKKKFGKSFLKKILLDVKTYIDEGNTRVHIIQQDLPYSLFTSERSTMFIIGMAGLSRGMAIQSKKVASTYSKLFDRTFEGGQDLKPYLNKILKTL